MKNHITAVGLGLLTACSPTVNPFHPINQLKELALEEGFGRPDTKTKRLDFHFSDTYGETTGYVEVRNCQQVENIPGITWKGQMKISVKQDYGNHRNSVGYYIEDNNCNGLNSGDSAKIFLGPDAKNFQSFSFDPGKSMRTEGKLDYIVRERMPEMYEDLAQSIVDMHEK